MWTYLELRHRLREYEAPPPQVREHSLHEPQASHRVSLSSSDRAVRELCTTQHSTKPHMKIFPLITSCWGSFAGQWSRCFGFSQVIGCWCCFWSGNGPTSPKHPYLSSKHHSKVMWSNFSYLLTPGCPAQPRNRLPEAAESETEVRDGEGGKYEGALNFWPLAYLNWLRLHWIMKCYSSL